VTRLVNIEGLGDSPEIARRRAAQDMAIQLREWIEQRAKLNGFAPRPYDRAALVARVHEKNPRLSIVMAEHLATHAARIGADGVLRLKHDPAFHANSPIDISFDTKRALWAAIRCPVLLVYGAESWASNPAIDGRAADLVDARVELFEQAGHWVHHDRTEDFITMVSGFLA
jgi:pimeloyl-ACP methyl ester carboxylesterase